MKAITILKILAILAILASISIPILSYAAVDESNSVSVTCLVKGFAVYNSSLEVFVEINIYNSPKGLMPTAKIIKSLTDSITEYRKDNGLEEFDDDHTFVKIMDVKNH